MKPIKIAFFALTMLIFSASMSLGRVKTDDNQGFEQIWLKAIKSKGGHGMSLPVMFDAIAFHEDNQYEPDLVKFIESDYPSANYHSDAIRAYAVIGGADAESRFNALLTDPIKFETTLWTIQVPEKAKALKYMSKLGYKPSDKAIEIIRGDIDKLAEMKYPDFAVRLVAGLKSNGIDITEESQKRIVEKVPNRWRNIKIPDLKQSGIKPDWVALFKRYEAKRPPPPMDDIQKLFLTSADLDTMKGFLKKINESDSDTYLVSEHFIKLVNMLTGDMTPLEDSKGNIRLEQRFLIETACERFPDYVLLKMLDPDKSSPYEGSNLLNELVKRGYKTEVDKYIQSARENTSRDSESKHFEIYNVLGGVNRIATYDARIYFDILANLMENYKIKDQRYIAAVGILTYPHTSTYNGDFPYADEWFRENPEKLAKAIKIVLDFYGNPANVKTLVKREGEPMAGDSYFKRDSAFQAMLFLPEPVFQKYFAKLDPKYLTATAYLTGNYFGAEWAYGKDQEEFYKEYGMKHEK